MSLVSSREGIFEDIPGPQSKAGYHAYTNMSKAGINMITERRLAWRRRTDALLFILLITAIRVGRRSVGGLRGIRLGLWPIAVGSLEERSFQGGA
jgi:hypothetical protein